MASLIKYYDEEIRTIN